MHKLSLSAMEKILKDAGAARVSKSAKMALAIFLENDGIDLGKRAAKYALHSGRKTVTEDDLKLAIKALSQDK